MPTVEELRLAEYRIEQRRAALSRSLLGADEGAVGGIVAALGAIEAELAAVQTELAARPAAPLAQRKAIADGALGAATSGIGVTVTLRMAEVPTAVVHLLDSATAPLVSVTISYVGRAFCRVRVSAKVDQYSAEAVGIAELVAGSGASVEATVDLLPTFFPDRLRAIGEATRASLLVKVENVGGPVELEASYPIWLLARSTARLSVADPKGGRVDLSPQLGAFVTPNAPEVLALLRRAVDLHPDRRLAGYQEADEAAISTQVEAIYAALAGEKIAYVNSVLARGAPASTWAQRVRLPRESLGDRSANCLDGVVLMASLLEAASLAPAIVLVPGHAVLGFRLAEGADRWGYLDTTRLGDGSFAEACTEGKRVVARFRAAAEALGSGQLQRLAIDELRASGIVPME